jgi:mRNA-degrading endonuclease YafQ of YafQ-DinJ toxin-antitoxin module
MSFRIVFTDSYTRHASRWLKRHPDLKSQYLNTLHLLQSNPFHPSLRLHVLAGRLQGIYSISINLSYRITLELLIQDKDVILINIGDHDPLY